MRRLFLVACLALVFTAPARAGLNRWSSGGPFGGHVLELAFDPGEPGTVYAGTLGGVFRSSDHGATWTAANFGLAGALVVGLEVVPGSPGTLYIATDAGVQRSDDGGRTWQAPTLVQYINAFTLAPANPQTLYASTRRTIHRSTDGGASWTPGATLPGHLDVSFLKVDPLAPSFVYAGTGTTLFYSQDGGNTFIPLLGLQADLLLDLALHPTNSQILYASTSDGVFKSTDRGQTWARSGLAGQYLGGIIIDPASPSTLLALGHKLFRSTDAGGSWSSVFDNHSGWNTAAIDPSLASSYLLGTSEGIYKSTNGGASWLPSNAGLAASLVRQLAVDPHRPGTLYAVIEYNETLHKSVDAGATWSRVDGISGVRTFALDPQTPSLLYAATSQGFLRSHNGGSTWILINGVETPGNLIAIDPQTPPRCTCRISPKSSGRASTTASPGAMPDRTCRDSRQLSW